jgi:spore maturation protein CgeB
MLFTDQFEIETIRRISERGETLTFNWFADDHWRFEDYSRHWAPAFNWVSTTAQSALPKYAAIGYTNVIKTQWACNHFLYRPLDLPLRHDVTFVGQPHGNRRETIETLRQAGIAVETWGYGWENGRIGQEEMIALFNQSRINLNLSNASVVDFSPLPRRAVRRVLRHAPATIRRRPLAKRLLAVPTRPVASQIKGRNFEVPGTSGFLLTDPADNLDAYYLPDREVGLFQRSEALVERVRYFLDNEEERAAIARAGYARTVAEHTYVQRFKAIFAAMGLTGQ